MDWIQLGLDIDGEAGGDQSGWSVSLSADGSTLAIGARHNDGSGNSFDNRGHVRIYTFVNGTWVLQKEIDGEGTLDESGRSVSLSADGSTLAVGAILNNENGTASGHVRIYKRVDTEWNLQQEINGEAAYDNCGRSVSLSADGSTLAIGATNNAGSGHVRIYTLVNGNEWTLQQEIHGEAGGDQFGISVSLSADGSTLAIGAISNDENGGNSGHVRVYKRVGIEWNYQQEINGEAFGDESGYSVSLSANGSTLAIGAIGNDGSGGNSGHVRVYKDVSGTWVYQAEINGKAVSDGSGWSVSLSADGSTLAIGAPYNDGGGISTDNRGHVRVYTDVSGTWTLQKEINGEAGGDQNGYSVSLSADGSTLAIGAPYNDGGGISTDNRGHVRVYRFSAPPTVAGPNLRPVSILLPIQVDFNQFGDITVRVEGEDVSYNYDLRLHYYSKSTDTKAVDLCNNVFKYNESTVSDALTDVSCSAPTTLKGLIKTALDASDLSCAVPRKVYGLSGDMAMKPDMSDNSGTLLTTRPALMKDYLRGWLYTYLYDIIGLAATTGSIELDMSGFSEYISENLKTQLCDGGATGAAVREFIFKAMFVQDPVRFQNASGASTAPDFSGQTLANKDLLRGMPFKAGDSLSFLIKFNFPKGNIKAPVQSTVLRTEQTQKGIVVGEQTNITVSTKSLSNTIAPGDLFRDFRQCLVWLQVHIEH
jgi:hypothetical protein